MLSSQEPPPAYDEQGPQGSTDSNNASNPDFVTAPTNFVAINEETSIRDNYTIDTSLQPIHMNFGNAMPRHRHHLALDSGSGYIQTKIRLIGSNRETAMLVMQTKKGNIYVSVIRSQQEFVLKARSIKGSLKIRIPRGFRGPIQATASSGDKIQFSDEMKKHIMPLSSSKGDWLGFLGPRKDPRRVHAQRHPNVNDWTGDKVIAVSKEGSISFAFEDESEGSCVIQ